MYKFDRTGMVNGTQEAQGDNSKKYLSQISFNNIFGLILDLCSSKDISKKEKSFVCLKQVLCIAALLLFVLGPQGLLANQSSASTAENHESAQGSNKSTKSSSADTGQTKASGSKAAGGEKTVTRIDPITGEEIVSKSEGDWKVQGQLSSTLSSTINQDDDLYNQSLAMSVRGTFSYVPLKLDFEVGTSMSQELTYEPMDGRDTRFGNVTGGVSRPVDIPWLNYSSVGLSGALGTSQSSAQNSFRGSLGTYIYMSKKVAKVTFSQVFAYDYNFYEFDITIAGRVNSPHTYYSSTGARWAPIKNLTLGAGLSFLHSVSFQDVGRTTIGGSLSASYRFMKSLSATFGFKTQSNGLDPSGQNTEIDFLDPRDAVTYLSLSMSI